MSVQAIVSSFSAIIALGSAVLTALAVRQQRMLARYTGGYAYIANAETMLGKFPSLFALHGIEKEALDTNKIRPEELVYLIHSFTGADLYHNIEGKKIAALTEYRKTMLANPKVCTAWKSFIKGRFIAADGPFARTVDEYLSAAKTAPNPGPQADG